MPEKLFGDYYHNNGNKSFKFETPKDYKKFVEKLNNLVKSSKGVQIFDSFEKTKQLNKEYRTLGSKHNLVKMECIGIELASFIYDNIKKQRCRIVSLWNGS